MTKSTATVGEPEFDEDDAPGLMYDSRITARVTLRELSPYSQSKKHEAPAFENESPGDYDKRTWRDHLHVQNGTVRIPARAITECLREAAQYSGLKIEGQRNKTWTDKLRSGVVLLENPDLGIKPEDVPFGDFYCHASGKPGSGTRVMRRFPLINSWQTTFDLTILDPQITEKILRKMIGIGGTFRGIGRYRPGQSGGTNGRFMLVSLEWIADLEYAQAA